MCALQGKLAILLRLPAQLSCTSQHEVPGSLPLRSQPTSRWRGQCFGPCYRPCLSYTMYSWATARRRARLRSLGAVASFWPLRRESCRAARACRIHRCRIHRCPLAVLYARRCCRRVLLVMCLRFVSLVALQTRTLVQDGASFLVAGQLGYRAKQSMYAACLVCWRDVIPVGRWRREVARPSAAGCRGLDAHSCKRSAEGPHGIRAHHVRGTHTPYTLPYTHAQHHQHSNGSVQGRLEMSRRKGAPIACKVGLLLTVQVAQPVSAATAQDRDGELATRPLAGGSRAP
jgi:hypothetical protein